jgi:hypothetical protein
MLQTFGEVSRRIVEAAYDLNLLPSKDIDEVSGEEADKLLPYGSFIYGTNARGGYRRAETLLGWAPQQEDLAHEIPRAVAAEARELGILKGNDLLPCPEA